MVSEESGKTYIAWDPKFELGIPVIDSQHKKLVDLCNRLYEDLMKNKDKDGWQMSLSGTLKECVEYVRTHFHDEEVIMRAAEYENLQSNIMSAAARGYVDLVVDPADTRKYLIAAFEMLYTKYVSEPDKKHGTK